MRQLFALLRYVDEKRPVFLPLIMILIKGLALALQEDLLQVCVVPADIAFSGFAFDIYALDMISRGEFIWPQANRQLREGVIATTSKELHSVEKKLTRLLFFGHILMFLMALLLASIFSGILVIVGIICFSLLTIYVPLLIVEGTAQKAWLGV